MSTDPLLPASNSTTTRSNSSTSRPQIAVSDLDVEQAESALLLQLEQGTAGTMHAATSVDPYSSSYQSGGGLTDKSSQRRLPKNNNNNNKGKKTTSFADIARHVSLLTQSVPVSGGGQRRHHRSTSVRDVLNTIGSIGEGRATSDGGPFFMSNSNHHEQAMMYGGVIIAEGSNEESPDDSTAFPPLPARSSQYGAVVEEITRARKRTHPVLRCVQKVCVLFHPQVLLHFFCRYVLPSLVVLVTIPCCGVAWILFYELGNPQLDFLPGTARLSWWMNFIGRQCVTFELARLGQWLLLDFLVLGFGDTVSLLGPLTTMIAIHARGWPFVLVLWSVLDLLVLCGDGTFQTHWLYWTGWAIYTQNNSGKYILTSGIYLNLLLSLLLAGTAATAKRTYLAIYFGRRQIDEFKPRLEKILRDILLLSDLGELAGEAEALHKDQKTAGRSTTNLEWIDIKEISRPRAWLKMDWKSTNLKKATEKNVDHIEDQAVHVSPKPRVLRANTKDALRQEQTLSGNLRIKNLLDRWDEPVNKLDKSGKATIGDVLQFKRALSLMDNSYPFGVAFGPADSRDECIGSTQAVYSKLVKLAPADSPVITFDILRLITMGEDCEEDLVKISELAKLFRPDKQGQLTLLAFVQTCDTVYKRLRYFRASVNNSSVIDEALQSIFNVLFYFVLVLILLSIMQFHPWSVLLSVTSLLVSVSFALGSSVSRYVEGMLLIAVRRPFDLGDRIVIVGSETVDNPGIQASWFVEDITLYTTTLRFARTNEVSTINNFAICQSRIVNCNRSPSAIVSFALKLHISILERDNLQRFESMLEDYVIDHPRVWDSITFVRHDDFDADSEIVTFAIAIRHRNSWQDGARIMINRSELLRYVYECSMKLGVNLDTPPSRRLLYYGGVLEKGPDQQDYKKNLVTASNVRVDKARFPPQENIGLTDPEPPLQGE